MTAITNDLTLGDLLKYEAPNLYSRDEVVVAANQTLALGAVVGPSSLRRAAHFLQQGAAVQHLLAQGDALFVPYAAPHWVHAGETPSISLSVTWQCRKSRAIADALSLNPLLRRVGLPAYDPVARPSAPRLRDCA